MNKLGAIKQTKPTNSLNVTYYKYRQSDEDDNLNPLFVPQRKGDNGYSLAWDEAVQRIDAEIVGYKARLYEWGKGNRKKTGFSFTLFLNMGGMNRAAIDFGKSGVLNGLMMNLSESKIGETVSLFLYPKNDEFANMSIKKWSAEGSRKDWDFFPNPTMSFKEFISNYNHSPEGLMEFYEEQLEGHLPKDFDPAKPFPVTDSDIIVSEGEGSDDLPF